MGYLHKAHAQVKEFFFPEYEGMLASRRPPAYPGQKRVFFSLEAYNMNTTIVLNSGNELTIGYWRGYDILVTYAGPITSGRDLVHASYFNFTKNPNNVAVFLNSACLGDRQQYVSELMNHMPVKSLGTCLNNGNQGDYQWGCDGLSRYEFKTCVMGKFKFYLAFENTLTEDYVTEKFFGAFYSGSVPVYRGAPNVEDFTPCDHCYINANDFATPKDLADYLLYLNGNETAYNEYFEWRKKPLKQTYLDMLEKRTESVFCRLCDKLSYMTYTKK